MYKISWTNKAIKALDKITKSQRVRIVAKCQEILPENPHFGKPLKGEYTGFYRLRVGDYRVIYSVEGEIVTVTVIKVGHRKDIY